MAHNYSSKPLRLLIATMVGALLVGAVFLTAAAQPARAEYKQFCWGVTLPGKGTSPWWCDSLHNGGATGYITEVGGSGENHSVCVLAWYNNGVTMCSGGPNQGVYNFTPNGEIVDVAEIQNNAPGTNRVYAFVDRCASPCPG